LEFFLKLEKNFSTVVQERSGLINCATALLKIPVSLMYVVNVILILYVLFSSTKGFNRLLTRKSRIRSRESKKIFVLLVPVVRSSASLEPTVPDSNSLGLSADH
jgi:hypothetical protein